MNRLAALSLLLACSSNHAPTISAHADITIAVNTASAPLSFAISDPDSDADELEVTAASSDSSLIGAAGLLLGGGGGERTLVVTPVADRTGVATITVAVHDGSLSAESQFTVTVVAGNSPPTALADAVTTVEDHTVVITLRGDDVDGDSLSFAVAAQPAHGEVTSLAGSEVLYVPALDFSGTDSFTFTAADASATSAPATVTITVAPYVNYVFIDPSATLSGDGSKATPYRSWDEVPSFTAGFTYAQKHGTEARESIVVTSSGSVAAPIVIAAYGRNTDPLPRVIGSEVESGWVGAGLGPPIYTRAVALAAGELLGNVAEDGSVLTFRPWTTDLATTFASAAAGSFAYEPDSGNVYVWASDGADPDDHLMEVSRRRFGVDVVGRSHITIRDLHISNVSLHGVHCQNCSSVAVEDCRIEKIGGAVIGLAPLLYAGNGVEFGQSSLLGVVRGCVIADIFDSGITPQTYSSDQSAAGFTFAANTISRCGLAGIEVAVLDPGGVSGASLTDIDISATTITGCGAGWSGLRYGQEGRGIKIAANAGAGSIANVSIATTTIEDSRGAGLYLHGELGTVAVHRCKIAGSELHGIEVSDATSSGLGLRVTSSLIIGNGTNAGSDDKAGISFYAPYASLLEVDHNTFSDNGFAALAVWGIAASPTLRNNLFTYASAPAVHLFHNVATPTPVADYDYYREHGGAIIHIEGATSSPYATVADFRSGSGQGANSIGGADPLLDGALAPQASSPCIGEGTATVSEDYAGTPFLNPPTIGAYAAAASD